MKTHARVKEALNAKEIKVLKKIMEDLENPKRIKVKDEGFQDEIACRLRDGTLFAMSVISSELECGTAACIGGNMAIGLGIRSGHEIRQWFHNKLEDHQPLLGPLFCPWDFYDIDENQVSKPKVAAKAIRTFIETGVPNWGKKKKENPWAVA